MDLSKVRDPFAFLNNLPFPRPFIRYPFVEKRRQLYAFVSILVLIIFVCAPMLYGYSQLHNALSADRIRPFWIGVIFGALVVVGFVSYSVTLHRLWDDSKWLARYGRMEEANLLWVITGQRRLVVTYRFWTDAGKEVMKETVIDADGAYPLAPLAAGDVVPILYDPRSPRTRSMLWAEIERYVTIRDNSVAMAAAGMQPQIS